MSMKVGAQAPGHRLGALTPQERSLLGLLQRVRYGRLERLAVRGGQPVLAGARWVKTVKVLGDNGPHPAAGLHDYALPQEAAALLAQLRALGDGEVRNLEVRNGLPFCYELEGAVSE